MSNFGKFPSVIGRSMLLWWCCVIATFPVQPASSQQVAVAPAVDASAESLDAWDYQFSPADEALLDKVQRACFEYFMREIGSPAMLAKDKTTDTVCSIAAVGFQLSALPVAVQRGWISRAEGERRAVTALQSLVKRQDNKKFGIYFHYLDERTGGLPDFRRTRYRYELQASTVDHALLQSGAMTAASYFGGDVARLADRICQDANWRAVYDQESGWITMGWRASTDRGPAGSGEIRPHFWQWSSDEERLVYFLAVGSPTNEHAVEPAAYYRLRRPIKRHDDMLPFVVSWNGSLFTYFFSHCWIDYRHLAADDPELLGVDAPGVDWFENSRRAVLTHRARCIEVSSELPTLSPNRWGLAPCTYRDKYFVHEVRPNMSDKDVWYEGVVPPYAAGSAIMFTPAESTAALREYISLKDSNGGPLAWRDPAVGGCGFVDSFSLDPPYGHEENLGIDVGPLLLAIENARTGLVWRLFMQHDVAETAVARLKLQRRP